jgi:hypothetical protein
MHYSDSLLITLYNSYMFRRIRGLLLSVLLSYIKDAYSLYYLAITPITLSC